MRLLATLPTLVFSQQLDNSFQQNRQYVTLDGPVLNDKTIRAIGSKNCALKKMSASNKYKPRDPVWHDICRPSSPEFQWSFDAVTGLVRSVGSGDDRPFCWWVKKELKEEHQRVKIMDCDVNDVNQQFSWQLGRFVSRANVNLCVGFDVQRKKGPLMTTKCFHNTFYNIHTDGENLAYTTPFTHGDQSVRPLGFDMCTDTDAIIEDGGNLRLRACESDYVTLGIARPVERSVSDYSTQKWTFFNPIQGNPKGLIKTTQNDTDYCWAVYPSTPYPSFPNLEEQIVTKICDIYDEGQQWTYQAESLTNPPTPVGLIRSVKHGHFCIGYDYAHIDSPEALILLSHCHSSMFGEFQMPTCPEGHKLNAFGECEQLDDTPCGQFPCENNGVCDNVQNGTTFQCYCSIGYSGETCNLVDICKTENPCENSGVCISEPGSPDYTCFCPPQHTGQTCEIVLPCARNPCVNEGICANEDEFNYKCFCPPYATGSHCGVLTPPCSFDPCLNQGVCKDSEDLFSHQCFCPPSHTGANCEIERPCSKEPCMNTGVCVDNEDFTDYLCYCPPNVTGRNCRKVLPCANPDKCKNGGICANSEEEQGGFICFCAPGFTGVKCGNRV